MKASRIMLLSIAFLAIAGSRSTTFAQEIKIPASSKLEALGSISLSSNNPNSCVTSLISSSSSDVCVSATTTPGPKPIPTDSPTPTPTITQNITYQAPLPDGQNLDSDKIFNMINAYRTSLGLPAFETNPDVCSLALVRSTEIPGEIQKGTLHMGLYNRPLPYWIWENAKYGSNEEGTVAWWLASPLHHSSIVGDYKYSCVKCTGTYCSELFTSFVPKQPTSN
ncbi:MAG TPA: CAP domain-containing protein [Patescibacteria group bacterium]|nr:CAP domain-containing protein [Patescibacteria group bacterium]